MADYSMVTWRLFTGAAISSPEDVDEMVADQITDVIDCRSEMDDAPLLAGRGMGYLWCPTNDDGAPKGVEWFGPGIEFALAALAQPHRRVYTHCAAGVNRGPSMAAAILMALGLGRGEAQEMIRDARPQVGLRYLDDAETAVRQLGYAG
jgi:protein-tyrosine phosphatase